MWDLWSGSPSGCGSNWRNCPNSLVLVCVDVLHSFPVLVSGPCRFPLQHVLHMVARQMADLQQQSKSYMFLKESMVPMWVQLAVYVFSSCSHQLLSRTVVREQKTEDLLSLHHVKMHGHTVPTVGGLTGQPAALAIPRGAEYGPA